MRDFAQHGHIPVSMDGKKPCFDIMQIIKTPHFNFKKAIKKEAEMFIEEVRERKGKILKLDFKLTITAYVCSIYKIFYKFLSITKEELSKKIDTYNKACQKTPELIHHINKSH